MGIQRNHFSFIGFERHYASDVLHILRSNFFCQLISGQTSFNVDKNMGGGDGQAGAGYIDCWKGILTDNKSWLLSSDVNQTYCVYSHISSQCKAFTFMKFHRFYGYNLMFVDLEFSRFLAQQFPKQFCLRNG